MDYWGPGDPFAIRLAAAEFGIVLRSALRRAVLGNVEEIFVRGRERSFLVRALPVGYGLILQLPRRRASASRRAIAAAVRALSIEAGFEGPLSCRGEPGQAAWRSVGVEEESVRSRRPAVVVMGDSKLGLDVIGRVALDDPRERGYRIRLESGQEGTLVREPLGRWYLDEGS